MNDLSFSSSSPTLYLLLCHIYQNALLWKVFLCRKNPPPNSPLVHIKSKWKKEWPQWGKCVCVGGGGGGGLMEGDDR